jgi:hypothetical protein
MKSASNCAKAGRVLGSEASRTGVGQRSLADDVDGSIQHADVILTVSEVQTEGEPADNSGSGG